MQSNFFLDYFNETLIRNSFVCDFYFLSVFSAHLIPGLVGWKHFSVKAAEEHGGCTQCLPNFLCKEDCKNASQ